MSNYITSTIAVMENMLKGTVHVKERQACDIVNNLAQLSVHCYYYVISVISILTISALFEKLF